MWQGRDLFGQHLAIAAHIRGSHLEQVVEIPGDQVGLFDLGDLGDRLVEGGQCGLAGLCHFHFDKGDVIQTQPDRIEQGAVALNRSHFLEASQARLRGRFRQADPARQLGDRHAPVAGHLLQNRPVEPVQIGYIQFARLSGKNQCVCHVHSE